MKTIEGLLELVRVKTRSWVDPEITFYASELVAQAEESAEAKAEVRIAQLETYVHDLENRNDHLFEEFSEARVRIAELEVLYQEAFTSNRRAQAELLTLKLDAEQEAISELLAKRRTEE